MTDKPKCLDFVYKPVKYFTEYLMKGFVFSKIVNNQVSN